MPICGVSLIPRHCGVLPGTPTSGENALNMMVDKKLMFREGERFLSLAVTTRGFGEKSEIRVYVFLLLISSAMVLISRRLVCMALHPYQSV